ncbi:MAG: HIT family protein [Dehalococcoidia bacterium]
MNCVFCQIIARKAPGNIRYEDDEVIVLDNKLNWAPVMLLAMPKKHLGQDELWQDMSKVGAVAFEMGRKLCPRGFRLLSNYGPDAMQSQDHGHIHVIGGTFLGPYA